MCACLVCLLCVHSEVCVCSSFKSAFILVVCAHTMKEEGRDVGEDVRGGVVAFEYIHSQGKLLHAPSVRSALISQQQQQQQQEQKQ